MRKPRIFPNSLRQKALRAGLSYMVVYLRIHAYKWTEEKALSTPKLPRGRVSFVNQMRASEEGKVITMPVYRAMDAV